MIARSRLSAWLLAVLLFAALLGARSAFAVDHTVVGSTQVDYLLVPTAPGADPNAGADISTPQTSSAFNGLTLESSLKLSIDLSEHMAATVKMCVGCHGIEADMTYFDVRITDELGIRLGRFSPSFGAFNLRHDPANHKLSDKPLAYDMGRMLRKSAWNLGVLPSPFPDNGVEVAGAHWFGETAQLDYATYAVQGFRNTQPKPTDIDFTQSHFPYYDFVQNSATPTVGGRAALTLKLNTATDMTVGASGMYGTYDPKGNLHYAILGTDFSLRFRRTSFRAEYLVRRTDIDTTDVDAFKYDVAAEGGNFFVKHGAYFEVEVPVTSAVDLIARWDGLYRIGNVRVDSPLHNKSWMARETIGVAVGVTRNFRVKSSIETWQFSDSDVNGQRTAVGLHLAGVASF